MIYHLAPVKHVAPVLVQQNEVGHVPAVIADMLGGARLGGKVLIGLNGHAHGYSGSYSHGVRVNRRLRGANPRLGGVNPRLRGVNRRLRG
eukprot:903257-Prorocentrum_minimum.AAC.1